MTAKESSSRSVATTLVLFAAAFLAILDLFIVNVAYSDIRLAFHDADLSAMSWMLNTYTIVVAAVLAPAGGSAIATVIGEYFWRGSACSWLDRCPVAYRRRSRSWWPPALLKPLAPGCSRRVRRIAASGAVVYATGVMVSFLRAGPDQDCLADFLPGHVLTGLGIGLVMPALIAVPAPTLPAPR